MTVGEILEGVELLAPLRPDLARLPVAGLDYDSRRIVPGSLFFAFPGSQADGRRFAGAALAAGAIAIVCESEPLELVSGPWVRVLHGRRALATASGNFYRHPDRRLGLTGTTGTNGKTTTTYLVDAALRKAGHITAVLGTIQYVLAGKSLPAVNTTPESLDLIRMFGDLLELGGSHVTMEVSSHALALGRVFGLQFHTAVFTNLTRDHLDFHGTMDEYFAAKQRLFQSNGAPAPAWAVINADDDWAGRIEVDPSTTRLTYGIRKGMIRAEEIRTGFDGLHFVVHHDGGAVELHSPLLGLINVYNLLAAFGVAVSYGIEPGQAAQGVGSLAAVPGRFERVDAGQPFLVLVDYAHTPDALENLIAAARALAPRRVITLFGCGGDRDRTKRPLMGQAAAKLSDYVVLTSDNPRTEDPLLIINDALVGLRREDTPHRVEPERARAIRHALEQAQPGDVVLIAGKGHETYQILGKQVIHFDDREVVRAELVRLGYGEGAA